LEYNCQDIQEGVVTQISRNDMITCVDSI